MSCLLMTQIYLFISDRNIGKLFQEMNKHLKMHLLGLKLINSISIYTFFYNQHFYKQNQAEIDI